MTVRYYWCNKKLVFAITFKPVRVLTEYIKETSSKDSKLQIEFIFFIPNLNISEIIVKTVK